MPLDQTSPIASSSADNSTLARRLRAELEGEVLFDAFSRGRYATDASIYQIMPLGVVIPRHQADVEKALQIAREEGVPVLPRGGGTSQCGQTVGEALVLDLSKHLRKVISLDAARRRAVVQPGIVLDHLNRQLRPHGLWFPVDVSTASRAT
ncbi:MAG TPA: FAD-binding oxidoreductase, partial [Kiloniellales bacterium]|nr:FAD-binding oxidoreductase [Kiloniellales bacterium]